MELARRMHEAAQAALDDATYDYFAGGAGAERSVADNLAAWDDLWLRPRQLAGVQQADASAELLGRRHPMPVLVAPMGAMDRLHPEGAPGMARGAAAAGCTFVLATRAGARPSEVRAAAGDDASLWLQLYVDADRDRASALLREAREEGFERVVLTIDLPVPGRRDRELRHGALAPPVGGWSPLAWEDVAWVAERSGLPVSVKGVLAAEDAELAVAAGAEAIVVSNHGGRQLDGCVPGAVALAEVAPVVGGRVPLLVDGGIRDGGDVVRALALGAQAVLVGRPLAWALAAEGPEGVTALLEAFREDLARTLVLLGAASPGAVTRAHVRRRGPAV